MPEIKNTFSQGKMNKDLDERLIPNGQYRHALNIDVTAVDDSDAGVVKNIRGNEQVSNLLPDTFICVGNIKDERNNRFYWFVHNHEENIDAILEYDQTSGNSQFIAVDLAGNEGYESLNSFLNFTGQQITGINIVDDFLFWSDGHNEPKKLNVSKSSQQNPSLAISQQTHAYLCINGEITDTLLQEEHVTIIKKKPTSAPTIKLISAKGEAGKAVFEKVFLRFSLRYKYKDEEYSAFGPFTDVVFNREYDELINSSNSYNTDEPYNKSMVNLIKSIELYDFIAPDMPEDVVQVDILYKQENSPVIYSIENIAIPSNEAAEDGSGQFNIENSDSKYKGKYVIDSENIHAALPDNQFLRAFDAVPKSALAQEVVGNRLVYANYKQGYNFEDRKPTINANYILRSSQDFTQGGLKSLKSQRRYQLGYVLGDKYGRETPVFTTRGGGVNVDWSSPNYGLNASNSTMFTAELSTFEGFPSWADYYKFYVKSTSQEYYNLIMDKSYFPFSHSEFENKDDHLYISFASTDRNKLVEDDYIIAKKIYDSNSVQVFEENKYKILDISNEAPDAVKFVFLNLGSIKNDNNTLCTGSSSFGIDPEGNDDPSLFPGNAIVDRVGKRIDQQTDTIHMHANVWVSTAVDGARLTDPDNTYQKDIYISWNVGDLYSNRYKVTSITLSPDNNIYTLKLSRKISERDAKLAVNGDDIYDLDFTTLSNNTQFLFDPGLVFKCERRQLRSEEDFSGKFFVKIKHNNYLTGNDQSQGLHVVADAGSYWLFGEHTTGVNPGLGIINSASASIATNLDGAVTVSASTNIPSVTGFANSADDWNSIKNHIGDKFFIDDMNFIASNPTQTSYAFEAAQGWKGNRIIYPPISWHTFDLAFSDDRASQWRTPNLGMTGYDADEGGIGQWNNNKGFSPQHVYETTFTDLAGNLQGLVVDLPVLINGLEGIVTTTLEHTETGGNTPMTGVLNGPRRWKVGSNYTNDYSAAATFAAINYDNTYGPDNSTGKHFMHLSFLAPGVDLIEQLSSSDLVGVTIRGKDSFAKKLQGIWGGGAFSKVPSVVNGDIENFVDFETGGTVERVVEFEGNYDLDTGAALPETPGPGIGQGYDSSFSTQHHQQWNPAYSENGVSPEITNFVNRLKTPGQKFKFKKDPDETIYTILSVSEKHIYNHTSWRLRRLFNEETNSFELANNSVEEAASDWASFSGQDLTPSNSSDESYEDAATNLANKITDFGAAHNRRTCFIVELDKNPVEHYDPRGLDHDDDIDANVFTQIEFVSDIVPGLIDSLFVAPTIWETEPLQLADLNIYHEASNNIPIRLTETNNELFAPVGSEIKFVDLGVLVSDIIIEGEVYIKKWTGPKTFETNIDLPEGNYATSLVQLCKKDGSYVEVRIESSEGNLLTIDEDLPTKVGLNYFNCFCFGDGIESNRIRDGFNNMQISSGARVSATIEEPFIEEHRTNGLIYSGIYNSNSNTNNLNQFITAEKITKDLNPTYGSIQKLHTRSTDLVALCEDRIIKILANKDAVFNADGNPQLVATEKVLGQAVPFVGDYGISTHPESFASETYRAYFADKQRGSVLRLSMDGLTPISDAGMRDYFRDNLIDFSQLIGTYDAYNKQYNLTIKPIPIFGNILKDDFSEGEPIVVLGQNDVELIGDDPEITSGVSFSEPAETIYDIAPFINVPRGYVANPLFDSSVELIYHPGYTAGEIFPEFDIFEPQPPIMVEVDIEVNPGDEGFDDTATMQQEFTVPDAFEDGTFFMYSWSTNDLFDFDAEGSANPFDGDDFGGTSTKFNIHREVNYTHEGPGPASFAYGGGYDGSDENLGFGAISLDDDDKRWKNRVFIFAQTSTNLSQVPSALLNDSNDPWEALNKGIIFRGSPYHNSGNTKWGHIEFPSNGFTSNGTSQVAPAVLESEPSATNSTMFKGEEFKIRLDYKANHYGDTTQSNTRQNFVRLVLLDGNETVDASLFTTGGAQTSTNIPEWTTSPTITFPIIDEDTNAAEDAVVQELYFKLNKTEETIGDIAIQNLKIRIEVWSLGNQGSSKLKKMGETVITNFQLIKLYRLVSQDFQGVETVFDPSTQIITVEVPEPQPDLFIGTQPAVPPETIDPWIEVKYPATIDHITASGAQANIHATHALLFGPENPPQPQSVVYIDDEGNSQLGEWETGSTQIPEANLNAYQTMPNYLPTIEEPIVQASLPKGARVKGQTIRLDVDGFMQPDRWFILEIGIDETNQTISTIDSFPLARFENENGNQLFLFPEDESIIHVGERIDAKTLRLEHRQGADYTQVLNDNNPPNNSPFVILPNFNPSITNHVGSFIALFKTVSGTGSSTVKKIKLTFTDDKYNIRYAQLFDISKLYAGGEFPPYVPSNYVLNEDLAKVQRYEFPNSEDIIAPKIGFSEPIMYLTSGGGVTFNLGNATDQVFPNVPRKFYKSVGVLPQTESGYRLEVEVEGEAPDPQQGVIAARVTPIDASTPLESGLLIDNDVFAAPLSSDNEQNVFNFNVEEQGEFAVVVEKVGNTVDLLKIKRISLKDDTSYIQPGNAGSWVISGFNQQVFDDISWSVNEEIIFSDANPGSMIHQPIDPLTVGQTFELSFDLHVDSVSNAEIQVKYIHNNNSLQFVQALNHTNIGHNVHTFSVNNATEIIDTDFSSSIIFKVITGPFNGSIDNVMLKRVISDQEFSVDVQTISYSEDSKGWTSFKSYIPDNGLSLSNQYFTFKHGQPYQHYVNDTKNRFYGIQYPSSITAVLNAQPSSVKNFKTLNYEGSQARVLFQDDNAAIDIYNAGGFKQGWYAESITTDISSGRVLEFIEKENKWFNYIKGNNSVVDTGNFSFQGLGTVSHIIEE